MLNRWLKIDHMGRPFVAVFASGSAIAGWALWNTVNGRFWWSILAGSAALYQSFPVRLERELNGLPKQRQYSLAFESAWKASFRKSVYGMILIFLRLNSVSSSAKRHTESLYYLIHMIYFSARKRNCNYRTNWINNI